MPQITLQFSVRAGAWALLPASFLPLGMSNLGASVGMLARLCDGTYFCAHLDVAREPRNQNERDELSAKVESWLTWAVPLANVSHLCYSTTGAQASTFCLIAGIKRAWPAAVGHASPTLYFNEEGEAVANENSVKAGGSLGGVCRF